MPPRTVDATATDGRATTMRALSIVALLLAPTSALRVSPLNTRRQAVIAGASLVPGLVLPPLAAHADAIEDIARRNAEEAKLAKAARAQKEEDKAALEAVGNTIGTPLLGGAIVVLLGGVASFASSIKSKSDQTTSFNLDRNRLATPAERKKMGLD